MDDAKTQDVVKGHKSNKRTTLIVFCLSLGAAIAFICTSQTWKWFVALGTASVLVNTGVFYYRAFGEEAPVEEQKHTLTTIVMGLTLVIPFSVFYVMIVWLLKGFPFPP